MIIEILKEVVPGGHGLFFDFQITYPLALNMLM